jgi:hypothetical protein
MIHQTFVLLTFLLIFFSLTMANPCPCELVVNEPSLIPTTDSSSGNQLIDDDSTEDYLEQVGTNNPSSLYPLIHQTKSLATFRRRFKRPSWATVGKRSSISIKKRPSWAQVG